MEQAQVTLTEIDDVYTLTYRDRGYERRAIFLDWYSAQANYERRAQEAREQDAQGAQESGAGNEE